MLGEKKSTNPKSEFIACPSGNSNKEILGITSIKERYT